MPTTRALLLLITMHLYGCTAKRRQCPPDAVPESMIVEQILNNYTKMLPQSEDSVKVTVEMHVQDMSSLNEITSDFEIDILFTQLWHDPALSFSHISSCKRNITMEAGSLSRIWTPNTCLINSKKTMVHSSPTENIMFILYENGTVWVNHRLAVKAPCDLDLRKFPFDTQSCMLVFESYSHNSEEVELNWMAPPIVLMKTIVLPDFDLLDYNVTKSNEKYPNGHWDELQATFIFKRRYGFYIIQAYVPTYLTIIVSWVSFCMEPKALPARTTVGISSLLALTFQFGNILKNLPRVSYVKAMDVWMLGCISFVFGTMLELAFVCYISRCQNSTRQMERKRYERRNQSRLMSRNGIASRGNSRPLHLDDDTSHILSHYHSNGTNGTAVREGGGSNGTRTMHEVIHPPVSPVHFHLNRHDSIDGPPLNVEQVYAHTHFFGAHFQPPRQCLPLESLYSLHANGIELSSSCPPQGQTNVGCFMRFHPESVDKFSIVMFPLAFTLFNLFYWWHYLTPNGEANLLGPSPLDLGDSKFP